MSVKLSLLPYRGSDPDEDTPDLVDLIEGLPEKAPPEKVKRRAHIDKNAAGIAPMKPAPPRPPRKRPFVFS